MKKEIIVSLKNEINNAKDQNDICHVVDKFDDSCDLDSDDDIYTESDIVGNIYNLDCYGESKQDQLQSGIDKDTIEMDKETLERLDNNDYPDGFDLFFYDDGNPVSLMDLKNAALGLLDENI